MNKLTYSLFGAVIFLSQPINAETFGGIEFPAGESSFADRVVSYEPMFNGGPKPASGGGWDKPEEALGISNENQEDCCAVTLGNGGRITLQFIDNALSGSNDSSPDLHIFEIGADVEDTFVEISKDGVDFISIGKVFGSTSSIDIDSFGFSSEDHFYYVRLTDDPDQGGSGGQTPGADIDAVGAIASVKLTENCSVSSVISENLDIHIPNAVFQSPSGEVNLWVNFKYYPNLEGKLLFEVTEYGEVK